MIPSPPSLADRLAALLFERRAHLLTVVSARFPNLCPGRVEDAVSGAFEVLARDPDRFQRALQQGGLCWMVGLALTISCRDARDQIQRHAYSRELGCGTDDTPFQDRSGVCPDLALAYDLQRDLESLLQQAAAQHGANRAPQVLSALREKLETGDEDTALAVRHGLRREHVNRAWSQVRREIRAA